MKIHSAGGTKTLFEWYMDMDIMVQLESLAAIANLTLSTEVMPSPILLSDYEHTIMYVFCVHWLHTYIHTYNTVYTRTIAVVFNEILRKTTILFL